MNRQYASFKCGCLAFWSNSAMAGYVIECKKHNDTDVRDYMHATMQFLEPNTLNHWYFLRTKQLGLQVERANAFDSYIRNGKVVKNVKLYNIKTICLAAICFILNTVLCTAVFSRYMDRGILLTAILIATGLLYGVVGGLYLRTEYIKKEEE